MEKKESRTLNYYDGISRGYKNLYHAEQISKILKIMNSFLLEGIMLDLGSGDGVLNAFIDSKVDLISFDLSFELLKLNSNNCKVQGSILNLPFKNESFNMISSFTVFQDLPDVKRGISEVLRVLKVEGVFILSFLQVAKDCVLLFDEIEKSFEILEKIDDNKDYIFILKKLKNN